VEEAAALDAVDVLSAVPRAERHETTHRTGGS
jgi:hypothetical protein